MVVTSGTQNLVVGQTANQIAVFPLVIQLFHNQLTANGASSVEQLLQLPGNALVLPPFTVTVRAGRADWTRCRDVGQVRQQGNAGGGTSVVVDFGVLRTVAGVGLTDTSKYKVQQVLSWTGTAFAADKPLFHSADGSFDAAVVLPSQIRTERLQIDLLGKADDATLGDSLLVQLPDLPADLELRINGGAPVWTAPGPAAAGTRGWQAPATATGLPFQTVDLSAAITALLDDPTAPITPAVDLHLVLSARVPGALQLDLPAESERRFRYRTQVALPPGADSLSFAAEGLQSVPLPLPDWVQAIEQVELTLAAKLPPERTVPPLGPDVQPVAAGSPVPLAEMALDPERAAAVALPAFAPHRYVLGELVAVRLPLRAEAAGAEVRVLLLAGDNGQPGDPLPGAVSKPVELAPADPAALDPWSTFTFPRPIPLDSTQPAQLPFVALLVTRGRVRWAFTNDATAGAVFFGPPDGPWQPLPGLADLSDLRGRLRLVGHAPSGQPIAPLEVGLAGLGARQPVTPTPKGVTVTVGAAGSGIAVPPPAALEVLSLTAGTVTLRDVVVTATRKP